MKKILVLIAAVFTFGVFAVKADNDRVINKENLPASAQQFINTHFGNNKISFVKEERDFLEKSYEVVFTDGTKLEFSRKGEWTDVDCRYSEVPAAVVPEPIRNYVAKYYAGEKILKIDHERGEYEVRLSNRLELTFDSKYRIIDIDN